MTITVTQQDIHYGVEGSCYKCPIALAITRATGRHIYVTKVDVGFTSDRGDVLATIPPAAVKFIDRFDDGRPGKPFSFKLKVPPTTPSMKGDRR